MNAKQLAKYIADGGADAVFSRLYGADCIDAQRARYITAASNFESLYGNDLEVRVFSVPGRSEICGNHTDHNHGRVIAASVDLDVIAVAAASNDDIARIKSEGFPEDVVNLKEYTEPDKSMYFTSAAIIAGMADGLRTQQINVRGLRAYTTSNVYKGSGLSSSAAFEVLVGTMFSDFYGGGSLSPVMNAKLSQRAENLYFGKPCGLMDQTACAVGGFITIDFADPASPVIEKLPFDLTEAGYALCIVNTGGNHADLNEDYASVPAEMKAVAAYFGKEVLRDCSEAGVTAKIPELREKVGDRAVMRALHFFEENRRVGAAADALRSGDVGEFLAQIRASGESSFKYLQNVYTTKNVKEQGLSLALMLTERCLSGPMTGHDVSAWRVHGGGFAGTIQAFVPASLVDAYKTALDAAFGDGACRVLHVRNDGAFRLV